MCGAGGSACPVLATGVRVAKSTVREAEGRDSNPLSAERRLTDFASLDGVMEAPGGEPFKYPGWSFEFDRGDDGNQFKPEETRQADALLIGRRTYESFAGAWP